MDLLTTVMTRMFPRIPVTRMMAKDMGTKTPARIRIISSSLVLFASTIIKSSSILEIYKTFSSIRMKRTDISEHKIFYCPQEGGHLISLNRAGSTVVHFQASFMQYYNIVGKTFLGKRQVRTVWSALRKCLAHSTVQ